MIRAGVAVVVVLALAVAVLALAGEAGHASIIWMGWRADMTAAALVVLTLFGALTSLAFWRLLLWVIEAPRRAERTRQETRRRQAGEVLTRGFLAVAAGDGTEARRLAAKAAEKLGYKNVKHMSAGISGWKKAGEAVEKAK